MEGRSSQIGVDDDSRGIDNPAESRLDLKVDLLLEEGKETLEGEEGLLEFRNFFLIEQVFPKSSQSLSDGFDDNGSRIGF
jgi:hypothetical protein